MGDVQRLTDTERLEILTLLEAATTERSAMRAARALARLMRHFNALGQRIARELANQGRPGEPSGGGGPSEAHHQAAGGRNEPSDASRQSTGRLQVPIKPSSDL